MSVDKKDIIEFIGKEAKFDEYSTGYIWGVREDGELQMIGEVRGYGAIQNLFKTDNGLVDFDKANEFQDAVGKFIAEAITEKIERES